MGAAFFVEDEGFIWWVPMFSKASTEDRLDQWRKVAELGSNDAEFGSKDPTYFCRGDWSPWPFSVYHWRRTLSAYRERTLFVSFQVGVRSQQRDAPTEKYSASENLSGTMCFITAVQLNL